jgi:hypothetical protein
MTFIFKLLGIDAFKFRIRRAFHYKRVVLPNKVGPLKTIPVNWRRM